MADLIFLIRDKYSRIEEEIGAGKKKSNKEREREIKERHRFVKSSKAQMRLNSKLKPMKLGVISGTKCTYSKKK